MKRRDYLNLSLISCSSLALVSCQKRLFSGHDYDPNSARKPNIVIMMADDMGYSDIGCYGGEIDTPNLDTLAKNGLRFTQFYNTAHCCPTRTSLLTGVYPHQAGMGHMTQDRGYDGYRGDLNRSTITIAEALKPAGYKNYMVGKWHVTRHMGPNGPKHNWPLQRGFDQFYGTILGAGSFYDPATLTQGNTMIAPDKKDYYYTDAIAEKAESYIESHEQKDPFFMYVAFTAPHWPLHARPRDIKRYQGRYKFGWDQVRKERYEKMLKVGLINENCQLTKRDQRALPWNKVKPKEKAWYERRMEVYAAMVDSMDQAIGRIIKALKTSGQFENTIIFFNADNGGCAEEYGQRPQISPPLNTMKERQPMKKGELQLRMQPARTREGRVVRVGRGLMPGPANTYVSYGLEWANASNTPFRQYKHRVHEGGIASPLIVHWPKGIQRKNELEHQPCHVIDYMATCIELAGAIYPTTYKNESIKPLEGKSLLPAFRGIKIDREALYWEHEGNRAIRLGNWKLVSFRGEPWELYDLDKDRSETTNLANQYPEITKKLGVMWNDYAARASVFPLTPPLLNRKKNKLNTKVIN